MSSYLAPEMLSWLRKFGFGGAIDCGGETIETNRLPPAKMRGRTGNGLDKEDVQEWLVGQLKQIHAGLAMVEDECVELERNFTDRSRKIPYELKAEQWTSLIDVYRSLLREHHRFFILSQHPLASQSVKRLAWKHKLPLRMWERTGEFVTFLARYAPVTRDFNESVDSLRHEALQALWDAEKLFQETSADDEAEDEGGVSEAEDGEAVECMEGELLMFLFRTEQIFDLLIVRIERRYHQILSFLLMFYFYFAEFPHGMRHLCTTMPWTIWPALVVLWGVCWMFYPNDRIGSVSPTDTISLPPQRQGLVMQEFPLPPYEAFVQWPTEGTNSETQTAPEDAFAVDLQGWGSPDFVTEGLFVTPSPSPSASSLSVFLESAQSVPSDLTVDLAQPPAEPTIGLEGLEFTSYAAQPPQAGHVGSHSRQIDATTSPSRTSSTRIRQRVSRSIQPSSFKCPQCRGTFCRRDALNRHFRETNHKSESGSARQGIEFCCSNPGCKRSRAGSGFKRNDKLKQHSKSCTARSIAARLDASTPSMSPQPPEIGEAAASSSARAQSSPERGTPSTETGSGGFDGRDALSGLKSLYEMYDRDLRDKEEQCRRIREKMEHLQKAIRIEEGG